MRHLLPLPTLFVALAIVAALPVGSARAEVTDSSEAGFSLRIERQLATDPHTAWTKLVDEIGSWWDPDHTFSGDAARLSIEPRPQGCFCESLPDGGGVTHLTVVYAAPGQRLRLAGGLGPLQEYALAGRMDLELEAVEEAARITLRYRVGGYVDGGLTDWAPAVDAVLSEQMDRLTRYVATGSPEASD